MRENDWQRKICKLARYNGAYATKWNSANMVGVPDLIVINDHGTAFLEVKRKVVESWTNMPCHVKVPAHQLSTLIKIYHAGGHGNIMVVYEGPGIVQLSITPIQYCNIFKTNIMLLEPQFDWKDLQKNPEWLVTGCWRKQ